MNLEIYKIKYYPCFLGQCCNFSNLLFHLDFWPTSFALESKIQEEKTWNAAYSTDLELGWWEVSTLESKGDKFLKELWCCISGEYRRQFNFICRVARINCPLQIFSTADISSISPFSEQVAWKSPFWSPCLYKAILWSHVCE